VLLCASIFIVPDVPKPPLDTGAGYHHGIPARYPPQGTVAGYPQGVSAVGYHRKVPVVGYHRKVPAAGYPQGVSLPYYGLLASLAGEVGISWVHDWPHVTPGRCKHPLPAPLHSRPYGSWVTGTQARAATRAPSPHHRHPRPYGVRFTLVMSRLRSL
jgi:hypothetical protein